MKVLKFLQTSWPLAAGVLLPLETQAFSPVDRSRVSYPRRTKLSNCRPNWAAVALCLAFPVQLALASIQVRTSLGVFFLLVRWVEFFERLSQALTSSPACPRLTWSHQQYKPFLPLLYVKLSWLIWNHFAANQFMQVPTSLNGIISHFNGGNLSTKWH